MTDTPTAIRRFVDATNAGDTEAFLDAFTPDATLDDWGREFTGRDGIGRWDQTDNIGVQAHFDIVSVTAGEVPGTHVATLRVSGNGYNGTGPMTFTLDGDRIRRLSITP